MDITYESICNKLGFTIEDYKPEASNTEGDTKPNPFSCLSVEEIDFLVKYIKENDICHS